MQNNLLSHQSQNTTSSRAQQRLTSASQVASRQAPSAGGPGVSYFEKIVDANHAVIFAPELLGGSCILDLDTLDESTLREHDGNVMLDVWMPPAAAVGAGFARHPSRHGSQG